MSHVKIILDKTPNFFHRTIQHKTINAGLNDLLGWNVNKIIYVYDKEKNSICHFVLLLPSLGFKDYIVEMLAHSSLKSFLGVPQCLPIFWCSKAVYQSTFFLKPKLSFCNFQPTAVMVFLSETFLCQPTLKCL